MANGFAIDVQDQGIQAALDRLLQHMDDLTPAMEDIARILGNVTEDAFQTETSPFGDAWLPLAESTLEQAAKKGRTSPKILQDSGQLAGSIATDAGPDFAELSVGKVYGAIHQFGGQAGRGRRVRIPARPYVPVNDQGELPEFVQEAILDVLADYLVS